MAHWLFHVLINVGALGLGGLFGFAVGCDYMRGRCRKLQAQQVEQASQHVAQGLRVVGARHE